MEQASYSLEATGATTHPRLASIQLQEPLKSHTAELRKVPLERLNCSFGVVSAEETAALQDIVQKTRRDNAADVVIVYALSSRDRRLALVGAVKETGADDQAVIVFYDEYFRHTIYKDTKWGIYRALGGKKINLIKSLLGFLASKKRFQQKGIQYREKQLGDSWTQGGILLFNKLGELCYTYNEEFKEFDMDLVEAAITEMRQSSSS